jgi:amidase
MIVATRREILLASLAALVPSSAVTRAVAGETDGVFASSEWAYATADVLVTALRARKVSALELTNRAIARIAALV